MGLTLLVTNIASLGPKKVGADQVLGPEFLVNFTALHLVLIDILFNKVLSVILMGTKMCYDWASSGVNWDQGASNSHSLPCNSGWSQN